VERGFEPEWTAITWTALATALTLAGLVTIAILRRAPARPDR
jgi:hypothetical protein